MITFTLLLLICACLQNGVVSQFCTPLGNETWAAFVEFIEHSSRFAAVCPFKIRHDGCPPQQAYPEGLLLNERDIIIACNPFLSGKSYGIDEDSLLCKIDCPGRHFTIGAGSQVTLDSFLLAGATNSSVHVQHGGKLEVLNSIFKNNSCTGGNGGAICALEETNLEIQYSTFNNNNAMRGGAVYSRGGEASIAQSRFEDNAADTAGGALAVDLASHLVLRETLFRSNQGSSGGAIYAAKTSNLDIRSSNLDSNFAHNGGAIYNGGVARITDSTLVNNFAIEEGGAMITDAGSTTSLIRNTFMNNRSRGDGPAVVNNSFNTGISKQGNTGCGNIALSENRLCNGVFVRFGFRRFEWCMSFESFCVTPTLQPSSFPSEIELSAPPHSSYVTPTQFSSPLPSSRPSGERTTSSPTALGIPTLQPSDMKSMTPTIATSFTSAPTLVPSVKDPNLLRFNAASGRPSNLPIEPQTPSPSYDLSSSLSDTPSELSSSIRPSPPSDHPSLSKSDGD